MSLFGSLKKALNPLDTSHPIGNPGGFILGNIAKGIQSGSSSGQGTYAPGAVSLGQLPQLNQPQIQTPMLTQVPQSNPGFGGAMPYIRNASFANTLGPLMQPNYGLPFISPYSSPQQYGSPGGGGLGMPMNRPWSGFGSYQIPSGGIGLQPIHGAVM
jgi:hypothetical protein